MRVRCNGIKSVHVEILCVNVKVYDGNSMAVASFML